jgi:hypothetical protein
VFNIGAVTHCTGILWAFLDLWNLGKSAYARDEIEVPDSIFSVLTMLSVMALCLALLFYMTYGSFKMYRDEILRHCPGSYISNGFIGVIALILIRVESYFLLWMMPFYMLRDSVVFYLSFTYLFLFEWVIRRFCRLSPWLGEILLITTAEKSLSVDDPAVWALILCI